MEAFFNLRNHWIHIRRGGDGFKSHSRYRKEVSNWEPFCFLGALESYPPRRRMGLSPIRATERRSLQPEMSSYPPDVILGVR